MVAQFPFVDHPFDVHAVVAAHCQDAGCQWVVITKVNAEDVPHWHERTRLDVLEGINKMKSLFEHDRLTIDPSCEDLVWELENYAWKLDKEDNSQDEPVKADDDGVDMTRYGIITLLGKPKPIPQVRFI